MKIIKKFLTIFWLFFVLQCVPPNIGFQSKITSDNLILNGPIEKNKQNLVSVFEYVTPPNRVCNGFLTESGVVVTMAHCVDVDKTYLISNVIFTPDSITLKREATPYFVINYMYHDDLAYLYPTKLRRKFSENFILGDQKQVRTGEIIWFLDQYFNQRTAIIDTQNIEVTLDTGQKPNSFSFIADIDPGDSGTPLFNSSNEIIGLITGHSLTNDFAYAVYFQDIILNND